MVAKVVYLTGAPAAGKSSTLRMMQQLEPAIYRFEYGAELTKYLQERDPEVQAQSELRSRSSQIVQPKDIDLLDQKLLKEVDAYRGKRPVIIDSHPVTKEEYGYRITAFSNERISRLRPDEIWCFYTDPQTTIDRITVDPAGRPSVSVEEARMHTMLQASVAATYAIMVGSPVYMFNTTGSQTKLVDDLLKRITV